ATLHHNSGDTGNSRYDSSPRCGGPIVRAYFEPARVDPDNNDAFVPLVYPGDAVTVRARLISSMGTKRCRTNQQGRCRGPRSASQRRDPPATPALGFLQCRWCAPTLLACRVFIHSSTFTIATTM